MGFSDHIIDDSTTADRLLHFGGKGLDLSSRGMMTAAEAYQGVADPFPAELIIPRSEWRARIQEMEEQKSRLSDLILQAGLPCKDQERTNYCWANATSHAVEIARALQNEPQVILSAASVGAQITGYRNVSGYGRQALQFIGAHGVVPESRWPKNAISRQYATPDNLALAQDYRQSAWWVLDESNFDQIVSCLLRRIPVAVGLAWWGHEVTYYDAAWVDGTIAIRFRNSWGMAWGDKGFATLQGRRMLPDDAVAPRAAVAA